MTGIGLDKDILYIELYKALKYFSVLFNASDI